MNQTKNILILSSNPVETNRLRLDQEVREIEEGLKISKYRENFRITSKWAVRIRDIRRAMLEYEPKIIHFSGHGERNGLVTEDANGLSSIVKIEAISGLFELFNKQVECVILNACYSEQQAKAISNHIKYVIGMSQGISDKASIEFSVGFYDALGAGRNYEESFRFGCNAIQLFNIPENLIPILHTSKMIDFNNDDLEFIDAIDSNGESDVIQPKSQKYYVPRSTSTAKPHSEQGIKKRYAVFLSYDSKDQESVEKIAVYLADNAKLRPWFDQWELIPGEPWIQRVNRGLADSLTCAVFVGKGGEAPWQNRKIETALRKQIQISTFRVIPVLLPDVQQQPELPGFLSGNTWVNLRQGLDDDDALWQLYCRICGVSPGRGRSYSAVQQQVSSSLASETTPQPRVSSKNFILPGGAMAVNSRFYIMRQADQDVFEAIHNTQQTLVAIRGASQTGKTSLIMHTSAAVDITKSQIQRAFVDLQGLPKTTFRSLDTIWRTITLRIAAQLKVKKWNKDSWDSDIEDHEENISQFLEGYVFEQNERPLLICLDEVNRVFTTSIKSEFFGSIRVFYNRGALDPMWKNVKWLLATSSEPAFFIEDGDQSPFNIGLQVDLDTFTIEELAIFARRHGLSFGTPELEAIINYCGGRPYLVHILFYHLVRRSHSLDQLFNTQTAGNGVFRSHLWHYMKQFQKEPELAHTMKKVIAGEGCDSLILEERLESAGLVRRDKNQKIVSLCRLYSEYFGQELS